MGAHLTVAARALRLPQGQISTTGAMVGPEVTAQVPACANTLVKTGAVFLDFKCGLKQVWGERMGGVSCSAGGPCAAGLETLASRRLVAAQ